MIRILHLVSSLSKDSGVMSVVMNYYRNINRDKIQFEFCYFIESEKSYKKEIEELGGKCYLIPKPSLKLIFFKELRDLFTQKTDFYKAVHIHEVYLTFLFSPFAKYYGIKNIITHSHATKYSDKKFSSFRNRILTYNIVKKANYHFACSIAAANFLYGNKANDTKNLHIINNAVNCNIYKFQEKNRVMIREQLNIQNNLVIGNIGRFNEQKNHDFLIDIFKELKDKNDNVKLVLVGDGPKLNEIKNKSIELKLSKDIIFLGRRNDIPKLLSAMDVFILPSLFEGLPLVGVEAQTSGLPIVLSESITKEIGLFNYKYIDLLVSPQKWAEEILKLESINRIDAHKNIINHGFDITKESIKLQNLYISMT